MAVAVRLGQRLANHFLAAIPVSGSPAIFALLEEERQRLVIVEYDDEIN